MKTINKKRTKIMSMLLTLVIVFGIFASAPFSVSAATSGDYEYEVLGEDLIEITKYKGNKAKVTIPSKISGNTVYGIGERAFELNKTLKSVAIPESVAYVEDYAFSNCNNLETIILPENLLSIGSGVFAQTAFYNNNDNWEDNILYIDKYLISSTKDIEYVKIEEGTFLIANNAFEDRRKLSEVVFCDSLQLIGTYAFRGCDSLKTVNMTDNIWHCGIGAFFTCFNLEKVKLSKNLLSISNQMLGYTNIEKIDIPESVQYIGDEAFLSCVNLKTINIPKKYIEMGHSTFLDTAYCNDSNNWYEDALYINDTLIFVKYKVTELDIRVGTKYICNNLSFEAPYIKSVTIPDSVEIIGIEAFLNCPNLKSVAIPNTVEHIGWGAFGLTKESGTYYRYGDFKITGIKGSAAEDYAKTFGFEFIDGSKATSVKLNKSSFKLGVGETYKLEKTVTPTLAESGCKWSSSDKSVATVNSKGEVVGKKSGTATITLKSANGKTATCKVTVYKAPSSIKLNKSTLTLGVDEWIDLSKTVGSGEFVNGPSLTWTSSDKNIVTAQRIAGAKCQVRAVGVGTATVTVKTYNGKTATCKVTVKKAPTAIKIDKEKINLGVGEEFVVTRSVVNDDEFMNPESGYWGSHNKKYAKVKKLDNHKAQITGVEVGNTVITATAYNGKTAKATVTVKKAPSKITLNKKSIKLGIGETHDLTSTIAKDEFANNRNINWSSSNKKVVTVKRQPNGKATVTAVGTGTATITVKTYNGKTATCKVTVYKAPSNIYLDKTKINLGVGEKFELSRSVNSGAFVNGPSLTWISSDKNIIKVKAVPGAKGEVTGVGVGTATVTVKTYNGKTTTCKVTVHKAPSAITLNKSSVSLKKGKTYELTSAIAKGEFLNNRNINWSSSNKKVVTVKRQSNGKATLTAVGKGTATITVKTYNGKTATCKVTVK